MLVEVGAVVVPSLAENLLTRSRHVVPASDLSTVRIGSAKVQALDFTTTLGNAPLDRGLLLGVLLGLQLRGERPELLVDLQIFRDRRSQRRVSIDHVRVEHDVAHGLRAFRGAGHKVLPLLGQLRRARHSPVDIGDVLVAHHVVDADDILHPSTFRKAHDIARFQRGQQSLKHRRGYAVKQASQDIDVIVRVARQQHQLAREAHGLFGRPATRDPLLHIAELHPADTGSFLQPPELRLGQLGRESRIDIGVS